MKCFVCDTDKAVDEIEPSTLDCNNHICKSCVSERVADSEWEDDEEYEKDDDGRHRPENDWDMRDHYREM